MAKPLSTFQLQSISPIFSSFSSIFPRRFATFNAYQNPTQVQNQKNNN
jgi:hypothetical protein